MEFRWTSGLAVRLEGRTAGDDELYDDYTSAYYDTDDNDDGFSSFIPV